MALSAVASLWRRQQAQIDFKLETGDVTQTIDIVGDALQVPAV
jgi:hypothetical protein